MFNVVVVAVMVRVCLHDISRPPHTRRKMNPVSANSLRFFVCYKLWVMFVFC
jgi:hypothetical protein